MSSSEKARGKRKVQSTSPASGHTTPPGHVPHMLPTHPPSAYAPGFFTPPPAFPPGMPFPASPGYVVRPYGIGSSSSMPQPSSSPSPSPSSSTPSGSTLPPSDPSSVDALVPPTIQYYDPSSPYYIGPAGSYDDDGRVRLYPEGSRGFSPSMVATPIITRCIKSRWTEPWPSWGKVPFHVKPSMFDDFQTKCKWHPAFDSIARSNFLGKCADRVKGNMYDCRAKGKKPEWIYDHVWAQLLQYWDSDEFKKKRAQGKAARASERGGSLHTGGSVSAATQRMILERQEGRPVRVPEIFKKRHIYRNKKGEEVWVEDRAKELYERATAVYEERMSTQASECGSSTPAQMTLEEETALWLEVNGGVKKGSAYGLGSQYASERLNPGLFGNYTPPASSINSSVEAALRNEIEELKKKSEEERLCNEENMRAMRKMMQNTMCGGADKGKKGKGKSKSKSKIKSRGKGKSKRQYSSESGSESGSEATE